MSRKINFRRFRKWLAGLVFFIALALIAIVFILPPVIKPILTDNISKSIHRNVVLDKIAINPFTLSVTLTGLKIADKAPQSSFLSLGEAYVNLEGPASLWKRALILKEVRVTRPHIRIVRQEDGTYNFTDLLAPKPKPKEEKSFHFSVNNIRVVDGSIDFEDGPVKARHTVRNLNLAVPFISNVGHAVNEYVEPKFSALVNGQPYELSGKSKPFSADRETSLDLDIRNVDVPFYLKYLPVKLNCRIPSALFDAGLKISFMMPPGKTPSVNLSGKLALSKVAVDSERGEKILRLPALQVDIASAEPLAGKIHLSRIFIQSPEIVARKDRQGEIEIMNLVAPASPKKPDASAAKKAGAQQKGSEKTPLNARLDAVAIESANLVFVDKSLSKPAETRIVPLNFKATNLSTEKGESGEVDLSLVLNRKGSLSMKGKVGLEPMSAALDFKASGIGIKPFQPYLADFARIDVTSGGLSSSGRLTLTPGPGEKTDIRYAGKAAVSRLATRDKAGKFLGWRQLNFDQVQAGSNPLFVHIKGISLSDFYARVIVNPDGTLNLKNILGGKEQAEKTAGKQQPKTEPVKTAASSEKKPAQDIKIGKITLQGGEIDYTDHFIKPNYSARMLKIGGTIKGLSSDERSRATLDLRGNLGVGSPVEIAGKINPLARDLYADIKLSFKDIELNTATPYAIKYLGYPILKGKLTFDVSYLVENRNLEARNKVLIDQLAFGEKVESPEAVKAPVPLAVSLLQDRNGQINLDIPVQGNLDDPKFSFWPIVWQVIKNMMVKAATSPFSLISNLVGGGGEEASYVEFDYGSERIPPAGEQKINNIAKALADRPALKLEIAGFVDPERDAEGLKKGLLDRKIKDLAMKDLMRKGGDAGTSREQVELEPSEYNKYLKAAYDAEKFPKPRNVIGLTKSLPPEEMEKLMIANTKVNERDLKLLASERAENARELILKAGVPPGRVFVIEPPSPSPAKKDKAKASRIDFKLK